MSTLAKWLKRYDVVQGWKEGFSRAPLWLNVKKRSCVK